MSRPSDDNAPFSALAFKIMSDPFVGTLTFTRIYSGVLESGTSVFNSVKVYGTTNNSSSSNNNTYGFCTRVKLHLRYYYYYYCTCRPGLV